MTPLHANTALLLIDLQEGILPVVGGPYPATNIVNRAARLADEFRARQLPVILIRVGWSADFAELLHQQVDMPATPHSLPNNWWDHPAALQVQAHDLQIIKHQWGAFYGTQLELQLRRRGITTLVLGGVCSNIGVESTARDAWERGFSLIMAEDLCSAASSEQHDNSFRWIFPRIARVRQSEQIISALPTLPRH